MTSSPLGEAVEFLKEFGFYDVVLPFLLVFTIVFAVLEKTKIFGTLDKKPKQNINAMIAFVIALFFVAATNLVEATRQLLPQVVVLLITLMSFMMLVGFFYSDKDGGFSFENHKFWKIFLTIIFFIGIVLLSWNAYSPNTFEGLLTGWGGFWTSTAGVTLIFLGIVVGAIILITLPGKKSGE
ncbi:MAG: hypothetical protein ISS23_03480 [Nanoarchaeota archaeon]|nr:hypothetical protein [Nanoarchaeota archaeon]